MMNIKGTGGRSQQRGPQQLPLEGSQSGVVDGAGALDNAFHVLPVPWQGILFSIDCLFLLLRITTTFLSSLVGFHSYPMVIA